MYKVHVASVFFYNSEITLNFANLRFDIIKPNKVPDVVHIKKYHYIHVESITSYAYVIFMKKIGDPLFKTCKFSAVTMVFHKLSHINAT